VKDEKEGEKVKSMLALNIEQILIKSDKLLIKVTGNFHEIKKPFD